MKNTEGKTNNKARESGSLSGAAGVYFVAGELSRLGHIALPTVKNTKGIDIVVSSKDFKKTVYLQVKANKNKYDFWIAGKPVQGDSVFYVFVNLLSNGQNQRPEYFIVPSNDVHSKFQLYENAKSRQFLTASETDIVISRIKNGETGWSIVDEIGASIGAIRNVAIQNNLKIKYDRSKGKSLFRGENFPFCFYIRKEDENKYKDKWDLLFGLC
jgi:hypothetical protein